MTSAEGSVGLTDSRNVSTKVLAPPGGKSSISFTDVCEQAAPVHRDVNPCQAARNRSNVFASEPGPEPSHQMKACQQQRQKSSVFGETSQPAPIPGPREPHNVNRHQEARQKSHLFEEVPPLKASVHISAPPGGEPPPKTSVHISDSLGGEPPSKTSVHISAPPGGESHISFG